MNVMLNRRLLLTAGLATGTSTLLPKMAWAAADTDRRFIFVLQRGAADGLGLLAPTGDPAFVGARGDLALTAGTKLDTLFTLHPSMAETAKLFAQKQAAFAHAIASGYRERSHFDGQNVLECGAALPYGRDDGWMNRLLSLLPGGERRALALATAVPLALRGTVDVGNGARCHALCRGCAACAVMEQRNPDRSDGVYDRKRRSGRRGGGEAGREPDERSGGCEGSDGRVQWLGHARQSGWTNEWPAAKR
jgi:uncharacterized protein (DUF1501 family)